MGIWHGAVSIVALVMGVITDVEIFDRNNSGNWYGFGFLIGCLGLSWNFGIFAGVVSILFFIL